MKIILKYTLIFSLISAVISSCAYKEEIFLPNSGKNDGFRLVTASVENFSRHNVMTKATDAEESQVNNLAMLVYATPENGTAKVLIADPIYIEGAKMDFVINTTNNADGQYIANIQGDQRNSFRGFTGDLTTSRIYIVANINHLLKGADISTEDAFLSIGDHILTTIPQAGAQYSAIDIPEYKSNKGFPMIGFADADLSPDSTLGGSEEALKVSIKKLFAKINFKFVVQLDSENIPGGMVMVKTPFFEPIEWSVHNVPANYTLRDSVAAKNPVNTVFYTEKFQTFNFSTEASKLNKRIENSPSASEYFDFSFYMPEYKVLPDKNRTSLPSNVDLNLRQCYKPTFCTDDQKPTYVLIKGKFSDHQGHISEVQYRLYLGQDEIDDFQVFRNQELNNVAIIKGLTNYSHEGDNNISIDHRVDVTSSGYSIAMERETLLDSHYEFRPMDISIQEGAVVVVKLPQNNWFGAELHNSNNNSGVYDSSKPGLRKYFTTSLLNELGSRTAAKEFVFKAPDNNDDNKDEVKFRLWFYFDENVSSPYDAKSTSATNQLYREDKILVDYYESETAYNNGNGTPTKPDREFTFRQMNLWSIHADINDYYIEYFEEYLYNYASDDNYGVTTDGMVWGLSDLDNNLSTKRQAIYVNQEDMDGLGEILISLIGGSFQGFFNTAFSQIKEKYDYYLSRDNVSKPRDYAGIAFTKEIVTQAGIDNNTLTLSGDADSAIEYCYNKNKRNANGKVETVHWYLPAIDETEEILVDGFEYFQVFQSKYYWSSQPSFHKNNFTATYTLLGVTTSASGAYYSEDPERARATIVTETTTSAESGVKGEIQTVPITINGRNSVTFGIPTKGTETPHAGNKLRTDIHRVRCAYSADGFPHIFGDYNVSVSTTQNGTGTNVPVTISKSNDLTKGNVMLSNYLHSSFKDIGYPQYATYNKETQILTINMGQLVGIEKGFLGVTTRHSSELYNGNTRVQNQPITLKYNSETHSFSVIGNTLNLRTNENNSANYIRSFTRATN